MQFRIASLALAVPLAFAFAVLSALKAKALASNANKYHLQISKAALRLQPNANPFRTAKLELAP